MIIERLDNARAEIHTKTKATIDTETAATWGARAVAAWENYAKTGDVRWRDQAVEYRHESLEHAAAGVPGTFERISIELSNLLPGLT